MEDRLYIKLYQWRRRQQWVSAVHEAIRGGWWGAWLSLLVLLVLAAVGAPGDHSEALWLWPSLLVAGFFRGLLQPLSLREVAHVADQAHGLHDRLLTCYGHVLEGQRMDVVSRLLLEETVQQVEGLDPRVTFPNRWQRPLLRWSVPLLAVLLATTLLELRRPAPSDSSEQEVLASRQRLSKLAQRWEVRQTNRQTRQQLEQLLRRMPKQVPHQAARHLREQLRQLEHQLAAQQEQARQLESLAQQAKQAKTPAEKAAVQHQLQQLEQKLDPQHSALPDLQKAQQRLQEGQMQQAEQALQEAGRKLASGPEAQEGEELAQALQDESQQLAPQSAGQEGDGQAQGPVRVGQAAKAGHGKQGGQAANDFGQGSTNKAESASKQASQKNYSQRQNRQTRDKEEQFARLYGPERQHAGYRRERALMQGAKGRLLQMRDAQAGAAREGDPSEREAVEEFMAAKVLAEQSVAEEQIPAEHREAVRRYFDRIDPR